MAVSLGADVLPVLAEAKSYIQHNETGHGNENDPLVHKLDRLLNRVVEAIKNGQ